MYNPAIYLRLLDLGFANLHTHELAGVLVVGGQVDVHLFVCLDERWVEDLSVLETETR